MQARAFRFLLRHEIGRVSLKCRTAVKQVWLWFYAAAVIVIAAIALFGWRDLGEERSNLLLSVTYGFPYVGFMLGFGLAKREWRQDTHGWWLTLPYPRIWLLGTKYAAALLVVLLLFVSYDIFSFVLLVLYSLVYGYEGQLFTAHGEWMLIYSIVAIVVLPFLCASGVLTAVVGRSSLKPLLPLLWLLFAVGGNAFVWIISSMERQHNVSLLAEVPSWLYVALPVSWIASAGVLLLAARCMDRYART